MLKKLRTKDFRETQKLGKKMAQEFLTAAHLCKGALVIGLEGDLGGGKTTFIQGFAKGLGVKEKILSPTFVILKRFKIYPVKSREEGAKQFNRMKTQKFKIFYHLDCYRIQAPKELLDLGFREIVSKPENIVVIEWADRVKKILPKNTIFLKFNFIGKNSREIVINPTPPPP